MTHPSLMPAPGQHPNNALTFPAGRMMTSARGGQNKTMNTTNLIEPLTFEDGEVDKFINRNVCAICQGYLVKFPTAGRKWIVKCLVDGPVLSHNTITTAAARQMESDQLAAMRELR